MNRLATASIALGLLALAPARGQEAPRPYAEARDYARWEKEVAAYEAADREKSPPKDGILFIGSSTIRLWKSLADDYPGLKVINRGFGGTEIVDSTHFADRLIFPHEPKQIFLRGRRQRHPRRADPRGRSRRTSPNSSGWSMRSCRRRRSSTSASARPPRAGASRTSTAS